MSGSKPPAQMSGAGTVKGNFYKVHTSYCTAKYSHVNHIFEGIFIVKFLIINIISRFYLLGLGGS